MILYHCSPTPGLRALEPRVTPYFDKPRQLCLTELRPMALFYGIRHFEYTYGYTRAGELYYMEQFPGALAELYGGKSASLYLCEEREDLETTGFFDYLDAGAIVAAEWSENVEALTGAPDVVVALEALPDGSRRITVEGIGE